MTDQAFADVDDIITQREISIPLGVILEQKKSKHPWGDWIWQPVAVLPGAGDVDEWIIVDKGDDWTHYHIATMPLVLHRKETEALKINIESGDPHLYVILRENEDEDADDRPLIVHTVTASSYDAQDYLDTSEEIAERVPMPTAIFEWIRAFVQEHHVEQQFKKRKRDKLNQEEHKFGKDPIFLTSGKPRA